MNRAVNRSRSMKTLIAGLGIALLSSVLLTAAEAERFVQKVTLPSGQTAVVAEGDFEPRSTGSFSVRLYSGENAQFPTDDYVAGVIQKRDGALEKVLLADIDGDGHPEVVVIVRCVGTGGYLSAHAFAVGPKSLVRRATVEGLAPDADVVAALKKTKERHK
jgi:hypothetical protein